MVLQYTHTSFDTIHFLPNFIQLFISKIDNAYFLNSIANGLGRFAPLFEDKNWKEIIQMKATNLRGIGITDGLVVSKMMKGFKYHHFRAKKNNLIE